MESDCSIAVFHPNIPCVRVGRLGRADYVAGSVALRNKTTVIYSSYIRFKKKHVRTLIEASLHIVSKFQVDFACFHGGETGTNCSISNNILHAFSTQTR